MPSRTRRRAAAASLLISSPLLAACGFGVQTNQVYQPSVGSDAREGRLSVLGTTVVVEGEEEAQQGTLSTNIVNDDAETGVSLDSVTSDSDVTVELLEPVEIGPQAGLDLSDTGAVLVTGPLDPGGYVDLTFVFDNGTQVELGVPIVNDLGPFADVVPAEPDTTPSATPSSSPTVEPADPSETPSAGPSSNPDDESEG